eukprot:6161905-Prymnesium_polylepis.1
MRAVIYRRLPAIGAALSAALIGRLTLESQARQQAVPTLTLNTGASIPALGFGTYLANGDDLARALRSAIDAGYRHIDTAHGYQNEAVVGEAVAASNIPREEFFLTSKLWCSDHGAKRTRRAIEASLRELGTSYIDCFLIHAPDNQGASPEEVVELRRQSWLVMEEYYRAGKLRASESGAAALPFRLHAPPAATLSTRLAPAVGVSNFEPRHIEQLLQWGTVTPAVNQIELHAHLAQPALREYCANKGIVVESYGSIGADGLLDDNVVRDIAVVRRLTPAQVSLRHSLQRGAVVLAKSLSPSRIAENARVFDFALTEGEMARLDALDMGREHGRTYWDNSDVP